MSSNKINKNSYPNYDEYQNISDRRDLNKWLQTVKTIYFQENNGVGRNVAIKTCTAQWDPDEIVDFTQWLKFYEEGSHLKYKKAQIWFEGSSPGYFLPIQNAPKASEEKKVSGEDIDYSKTLISNEMTEKEKKSIIEATRKKFISRLDSAEKVLRTSDGELFAGKEMEALVEAILNLKKKIHLLNKVSTSTKIYDDMIIREANVLNHKGFNKAAVHLSKFAQEAPAPQGLPDMAPPPADANTAGGLPNMDEAAPIEEESAIKNFLKNMETANLSITDDEEEEKEEKKKDELSVDDDELLVWDDLYVNAQAAPSPAPVVPETTPIAPPAAPAAPSDVSAPVEDTKTTSNNFDAKVDEVFSGISVNDVVAKLEEIATVFRTREIPRQLSLVDVMLDHLQLASLFPNLSEAINKSLESNNYCLTRIEDITSKLRGTIKGTEMNLSGDDTGNSPAQGIKDKLQSDLDKEKERKEKRKEVENAQFDNASTPKETPEIELEDPNVVPAAAALPPK